MDSKSSSGLTPRTLTNAFFSLSIEEVTMSYLCALLGCIRNLIVAGHGIKTRLLHGSRHRSFTWSVVSRFFASFSGREHEGALLHSANPVFRQFGRIQKSTSAINPCERF